MKNRILGITLIVLTFILAGCKPDQTTNNSDQCIPPLFTSSYPYGDIDGEAAANISFDKPIIPPIGWERVSEIPDEFTSSKGERWSSGIYFTRKQPGYTEVWSYGRDVESLSTYIYRTDTKQWQQVAAPVRGDYFLDHENNVWIIPFWFLDKTQASLYRLDSDNTAVPVVDSEHLLSNGQIKSIQIGPDGVFWVLFYDESDNVGLYSFSPDTLKAELHLTDLYFFNEELVIDKDYNLYLMKDLDTVIRYNPTTGETKTRGIPPDDGRFGLSTVLYLDDDNRLWVNDRVWFDLSDADFASINIVFRSPIFIDLMPGVGQYVWDSPMPLVDTSDGRLWYTSSRGLAWFKPETGDWCLFTTDPGKIVKDSQQDLWIMVDDTLYTLNLR